MTVLVPPATISERASLLLNYGLMSNFDHTLKDLQDPFVQRAEKRAFVFHFIYTMTDIGRNEELTFCVRTV